LILKNIFFQNQESAHKTGYVGSAFSLLDIMSLRYGQHIVKQRIPLKDPRITASI